MSMQTLSTLLAAILTFVVGWSVILRDRRQRHYVAFTILCFNLCFWYLAQFFSTTLGSNAATLVALLLAAAIPSSAERFFRAFLAEDPRHPDAISRPVTIGTIISYLLLAGALFYPLHRSWLFRVPFFSFIFASLSYCVYLIYERQRRIASRPEATRLIYLFYGGAATVTLAATDFLPAMGIAFPTIGNLLTVIYMYFISQTLFHYRLLDVKELLGKMVTLSALVLILTIIYGLLLAWVGPDQPGVFFFNTVVASFVIMVIFEPLRQWVEDRVNRWLFAEKYEFARRLRLLGRDLANIIEVRPLVSRILMDLEDSGRVTHASIYLAAPSGSSYRLAGHLGPAPQGELDGMTRRPFFDRLRRSRLLTVEALERQSSEALHEGAEEDSTVTVRNNLDTMEELYADVCIPLLSDGQLLGLINVRDERLREAYASDELDLLWEMAAQAAITLRNSKVYEQMKERDRLAALGQMAAGLAHEIRNPLGSIKGAAQLLKADIAPVGAATDSDPKLDPTSGDGELPHDGATSSPSDGPDTFTPARAEWREFLDIIVEEVDRLDGVVGQFLGYARPDSGERELLNINEVLRRTLQLLHSKEIDTEIVADLAKDLPEVRADPEQLHQVFLNLGINAQQAMHGTGKLTVTTQVRRAFQAGRAIQLVEVTFRDQGEGIAADTLPDIFIPFFTTKEGGTGLGLPICQRIIENHGGSIEVSSEAGKGSSFIVLLPLATDHGDITQSQRVDRETLATAAPARRRASG